MTIESPPVPIGLGFGFGTALGLGLGLRGPDLGLGLDNSVFGSDRSPRNANVRMIVYSSVCFMFV